MARKNSRKTIIGRLTTLAVIALLVGVVSFVLYGYFTHPHTLKYKEKSNVDYKVHILENDFFEEDYLEKDNQYISSIIDDIDTNLYYKLEMPKTVKYEYSYKAKAVIEVKEMSNNNSIYKIEEDLLNVTPVKGNGSLVIDEKLSIDYRKYNKLINNFKDVYDLKNTSSYVDVSLYINVNDISTTKENITEKKVVSLKIPLAENTISIDNPTRNVESYFTFGTKEYESIDWVLFIGIVATVISIIIFLYDYIYVTKTRTAEMIYEKEIKSIINNYDSFIQKINGSYDIGTSQVIKIESFNDILEIRDTLKQPILMLENEEKNGTFFIIPATNSIIYTYALRVADIEAKMNGLEVPTYDITEITHENFLKNKKYTDDFIKDELTKTSLMPVVNDDNIIKGNKDKETNLYDQLELTSSFNIEAIKRAAKHTRRTNQKRRKAHKKKITINKGDA